MDSLSEHDFHINLALDLAEWCETYLKMKKYPFTLTYNTICGEDNCHFVVFCTEQEILNVGRQLQILCSLTHSYQKNSQ